MKKINNMMELRAYAMELQTELELEGAQLKTLARAVSIQMRPDNILQELHDQIESLAAEKGDLLNSTLSSISGGLGKFIVSGNGDSLMSRVGGTAMSAAIRMLAKKYPDSTVKFYLKLIGFAIQMVRKK